MKKILLAALLVPFINYAQLSEGFEGSLEIPQGWTIINGGDENTWAVIDLATAENLSAQEGTKVISILYSATAHADHLITPAITVAEGQTNFSFYARSRDADYPETISLLLSTTTPTAEAFTQTLIENVAPASGTNFVNYTADLSSYVGQTVYISFFSATTDRFAFDIDNVTLNDGTANTNSVLASKLSVYPNPATNVVNVNGAGALVSNIAIVDLNGRTVKTAKFDNVAEAQVNISDLSAGIYMMNVTSDKGTATKKIVKN